MALKMIGIRAALVKLGATEIEVRNGHNYKFGFFMLPDRGLMYFNVSDISSHGWDEEHYVMVRTVQHRKDYTGGVNEWWVDRRLSEMGFKVRPGG